MGAEPPATQPNWYDGVDDEWLCGYVRQWRDSCRTQRRTRWSIWNECWELYRGKADNRAKDNWQSKVFLPKAWAAVKQATNIIGRYLRIENKPYQFTAVNSDDYIAVTRGARKTKLTRLMMENAGYLETFLESLEGSFIMGIGVKNVGGMLTQLRNWSCKTAQNSTKLVLRWAGKLCATKSIMVS